jgi:Mg-chelatase subunit ChlD
MTLIYLLGCSLLLAIIATPVATDPEPEIKPCTNIRKIDLVIVLDSSASIKSDNYQKAIDAVISIFKGLNFANNITRAGMVIFGTHSYIKLNLTGNQNEAIKACENLEYLNSTTNSYLGLADANKILSTQGRNDSVEVVIIITDGKSGNTTLTCNEGGKLRDKGCIVISVGVGNSVYKPELTCVSSGPQYCYQVANYSDLVTVLNNITQQACHDTPPPPVKPCTSTSPLDLIFVTDSSGSVGRSNYFKMFDLIKYILARLNFDVSKVGIVIFGTNAKTILNLTSNKTEALQACENPEYKNSTTSTYLGIATARKILITKGRTNTKRVIVVITDGKSDNTTLTCYEAEETRKIGCTNIAVGVGKAVNQQELNCVSSGSEYCYQVDDFSGLVTLLDAITKQACDD